MENDVNLRLEILENALKKPSDLSVNEIAIQLNIIESIAHFYNNDQNIKNRISNIKEKIENNLSNFNSIYDSIDRCNKIDRIDMRIDRVIQNTDFINSCVIEQGSFIDQIETASSACLYNIEQAYNELKAFRKYQNRKNRFLRIIYTLIFLFFVLIILRFVNIGRYFYKQ